MIKNDWFVEDVDERLELASDIQWAAQREVCHVNVVSFISDANQ